MTEDTTETTSNRARTVDKILDNVTDIAAIAALGYVLLNHPEIGVESLALITSVALGKRYMSGGSKE